MTNLDDILRRIAYWNGYDTAGEWERTGHEAKAQLEQYIANQVREELTNLKIARLNLGTITTDHADGYQMAIDDMNRRIDNRIKELEETK